MTNSEGRERMKPLLVFRSGIVLHCDINVKECNQRDDGGLIKDGLVD